MWLTAKLNHCELGRLWIQFSTRNNGNYYFFMSNIMHDIKNAIAVASTPLHIIYIIELAKKMAVDEVELIVLIKRMTDVPQINKVLGEAPWSKVHWLDATSHFSNQYITLFELFHSFKIKTNHSNYDYGIFADYGKTLLSNIACNDYYWLGDGTKILFESANLDHSNRHYKHGKYDSVAQLITGKKLIPDNLIIFTPFDIEGDNVVHHEFDWLRTKYKDSKNFIINDDTVYFFGTYFSERNAKPLMTDDNYIFYMQRIADFFYGKGKKIIYVPHRHESINKLKRIASISGIKIKYFEYPAELQFYYDKTCPTHVASFFSTCLFHFNALGMSKSITGFYIDFASHNEKYKTTAETFYQELRKIIGNSSLIDVRELV